MSDEVEQLERVVVLLEDLVDAVEAGNTTTTRPVDLAGATPQPGMVALVVLAALLVGVVMRWTRRNDSGK